jgi:hypothetical protein
MTSSQPIAPAGSCRRTRTALGGRLALGLGVALCAVCCSIPLVAAAGIGGAALAAIGVYTERMAPVFLGAGVLAFAGALAWSRRRGVGSPCATDCACRTAANR